MSGATGGHHVRRQRAAGRAARRIAAWPRDGSAWQHGASWPVDAAVRVRAAWRRHAAALLAAATVTLAGCAQLPPQTDRPVSHAISDPALLRTTRLGQALAPQLAAHPSLSGLHTITDGLEAYAARIVLTQIADRTLDVQYYIWQNDFTGITMLDALRRAADRGVRVRLLLDDNGLRGLDDLLSALDEHPNIEVRIFNPFASRRLPWLGFLTDFDRLNHRMHNKSMTVDGLSTLVGGRNVGNAYFSASDGPVFADLDALAIGPVVQHVSTGFDRYWASPSAYPVARLLRPAPPDTLRLLDQRIAEYSTDARARKYVDAVHQTPLYRQMTARTLPLQWAPATVMYDDPDKVLHPDDKSRRLWTRLEDIVESPRSELLIVTPYFVPLREGTAHLVRIAQSGVRVAVLANSLAATDSKVVYAGYVKWVRELLEGGVELWELAPGDGMNRREKKEERTSERSFGRVGRANPTKSSRLFGSAGGLGDIGSGSSAGGASSTPESLHAKTFEVDRERIFIGSFNFDPRSVQLNTEMGFLVHSREMAEHLHAVFDDEVPRRAYRLRLSAAGAIEWVDTHADGTQTVHTHSPGTNTLTRAGIWVLSHLPIDGLL